MGLSGAANARFAEILPHSGRPYAERRTFASLLILHSRNAAPLRAADTILTSDDASNADRQDHGGDVFPGEIDAFMMHRGWGPNWRRFIYPQAQ